MKINKEIIIEELENLFIKYKNWQYIFMHADLLEQIKNEFATNLLSKLQVLDRGNVEKILNSYWEGNKDGRILLLVDDDIADQILQLIPEGEVIAEGEFNIIKYITKEEIGLVETWKPMSNKKGKLIFIENKEEL